MENDILDKYDHTDYDAFIDYKKAIKMSDNEAKTRDYLVEPFFEMLGYQKMDNIFQSPVLNSLTIK